jgi:hypothetical protein
MPELARRESCIRGAVMFDRHVMATEYVTGGVVIGNNTHEIKKAMPHPMDASLAKGN